MKLIRAIPSYGRLTLQLRLAFEVSFSGEGLMAPPPDGPSQDEGRFDVPLS
jgi:hypothetical protein